MPQSVRILNIGNVTHNVRRYEIKRPEGYEFEPGQATELSLDEDGWRDRKHPFTFTALPDAETLEFTIKSYFNTGGDGMTERLYHYEPGQTLLLRDPWGTITYKGPGTFIAGGAGITPFIAILRNQARKGGLDGHRLIGSFQKPDDIILRDEFEAMPGLDCIWTVTDADDASGGLRHDRIDEAFLRDIVGDDLDGNFYLCGPDPMVKDLRGILEGMGAQTDALTWEK